MTPPRPQLDPNLASLRFSRPPPYRYQLSQAAAALGAAVAAAPITHWLNKAHIQLMARRFPAGGSAVGQGDVLIALPGHLRF